MTALEVELPLIRAELVSIDLQLAKAETSLTWQDQDCWSFIQSTKHLVQDLAYRVGRAKENSDTIQSIIKDWSKKAMFCRKDNKKGSLIQLESKMDYVSRKYNSMKRDGEFIQQLIQVCGVSVFYTASWDKNSQALSRFHKKQVVEWSLIKAHLN